jgi:drug/metabolite transporter (DMT)-like permease
MSSQPVAAQSSPVSIPSAPAAPAHVPLSAVLLVCGATLCFVLLDSMFKHLSQHLPIPLLVWARWTVQAVAVALWLVPQAGLRALVRTRKLTAQLFRGAVLIGSSLCFVSALKVMPLAEVTALNYTTPVLVTILAVVFLDERMTRMRVAFVVAGFAGMLLVVRPGGELFQGAALFALGSAWFYAMFQITTRKLADEDWRALLFYPALVGAASMTVLLPFLDWRSPVTLQDGAMIVAAGLLGSLGHFLFQRAFQRAAASAITPFTYVQLVWSTLAGWIAFASFPDGWTLTGMAIITGSGLLIALHEQRKSRSAVAAQATVVD